MNKSGRPSKYETSVKARFDEIAEWLKTGATDKEIAENLGVNKSTFCAYKKQYPELTEFIKKGRKVPVQAIKAALYKRATGFTYSEKKTVIEYEEWDADIKNALAELGMDVSNLDKRRLVRVEVYEKAALPDPASAMILLKHWDKENEWTNDPATLRIRKQELEMKKQQIESGEWA